MPKLKSQYQTRKQNLEAQTPQSQTSKDIQPKSKSKYFPRAVPQSIEGVHPKITLLQSKIINIHDKGPAKTEGFLAKGFQQEFSLLAFRLHLRGTKLFLLGKLSKEVVTYIDVLRVRVGYGVNTLFESHRCCSQKPGRTGPKKRAREAPDKQQETCLLEPFRHRNILPLTRGECGTLLRPRNPLDGRTPRHHSSTLCRRQLSFSREHRLHPRKTTSSSFPQVLEKPVTSLFTSYREKKSSTCTTAITQADPALINRKTQGSARLCSNPRLFRRATRSLCQHLDAGLRP